MCRLVDESYISARVWIEHDVAPIRFNTDALRSFDERTDALDITQIACGIAII